jgi:rRNA processing protein Gar1
LNADEVTSIVGDQVVVKTADKPPRMGAIVYRKNERIGKVADIIGPVEKPYYVVKASSNTKVEVGDILMPK